MNTPNSETAQLNKVADHLAQIPPITVSLTPLGAWALVATLQLALRHPSNNGPTAAGMRKFTDHLISQIAAGNHGIRELLRAGYDPKHDTPVDPQP